MAPNANRINADVEPKQYTHCCGVEHENGFEAYPKKDGLYNPDNEKDGCGVGFVTNIDGKATHANVQDALVILARMFHRGACGCEENTGDGAGILTGMPHEFLTHMVTKSGITLPAPGYYAAGNIFFSKKSEALKEECRSVFTSTAAKLGLEVLGWRVIEVDNSQVGPSALATEPSIEQVYIKSKDSSLKGLDLDRLAYTLRKRLEKSLPKAEKSFYICSLSTGTLIYKGQLSAYQVGPYFKDLSNPEFKSHMALVHSRFSTNTFPSWSRAQPFRLLGHNGEINTLRGNKNWMRAREGMLKSEQFGDLTESLYPIIETAGSDSAAFDNVLEFMVMDGKRTLPEVMMMMVPEAWQNDVNMTPKKRAFYEYCSFVMEAWDGPALFTFTDGRYIGATLDRNGLRPARYYITDDNRMIMASEVGVLDVPLGAIKSKGRLQPGKMLLVDTLEHTLVDDSQLKVEVSNKHDYQNWLDTNSVNITEMALLSNKPHEVQAQKGVLFDRRLPAFGWTLEHINMLVKPMIELRKEALGSMGNDAPLAVLSKKPRLIHEYFKQLFAQVTNPPIDPFRESIIMSLRQVIGPEFNVLDEAAEQCQRLTIDNPVLSLKEIACIRSLHKEKSQWKVAEIDTTFARSTGAEGMMDALERISDEAVDAINDGNKVIVLTDRKVGRERVPIPSALAVGAVHQYLVREKKRLNVAIILESGEVNVVHQICLLLGFGVDAVCPYLVFDTMAALRNEGLLDAKYDDDTVAKNYQAAVNYGMRKVMAKMGISTLMSYKGAQIFEAVGIAEEVIDRCFTNCASRIKGVGFTLLAEEAFSRHDIAFPLERDDIVESRLIENPGDYHWRDGGEDHMNHPNVVASVQDAARRNNKQSYEKYVRESDKQIKNCMLRGLLEFNITEEEKIPIEEVIPAEDIVKRFCTGAMSYGSISLEAHSTLAVALNRIGGKSNTGEGGEEASRFDSKAENGDSMRSAIKQVASGRFGVSAWYLSNADEIQIKMAQGAKPGEGGELPGFKVSQSIADCRNSTPGVGLISPPPHHDIYSIEDLKQLIYDLKCANPSARVSVKLVSEVGVGVVAAGVAKGYADHILISGHDGGTGASSWTGIKYAGLPWELGLSETHQTLVQNDLRGRVVVQADGQIRHGRDVAIAALLGAEEFGFATVPLIVMGCTMMRKCHLNTCPVGIATQDPELRKKFTGTPEHVVNYFFMVAEHCREIMASLGLRTIEEMVGRTDKLKMDNHAHGPKAKTVDLTPVLKRATELRPNTATYNVQAQAHELAERKDNDLIVRFQDALKNQTPMSHDLDITNLDRAFTTTLSHEVMKSNGKGGLPDDTITLNLNGSAGQSLGAFLAPGITIKVTGDTNDYVGKGMMGGRIIVRPGPYHSEFVPENNIISGNVCLYGATGGEAFFRGILAERFCVRNSGATAVCEGVGDHGCEYMTGGYAVVLGKTGRNFAAGMSGGIAYVLDENKQFGTMVNSELVALDAVELPEDLEFLQGVLQKHLNYTGSDVAQRLLDDWANSPAKFVKVFPHDYKAALAAAKSAAEATAVADVETPKKVEEIKDAGTEDIEDFIVDNESEDKKRARLAKLDKLRGFKKYKRKPDGYRAPDKRIKDFKEIRVGLKENELNTQGARCMDCGVPFCQSDTGCPLGNVIPQWNDLVYKNRWEEALERLLLTNNFPEFTGRVCPAPCEGACVLGINEPAVAIKSIECAIIDRGFEMGWIKPQIPKVRTGRKVTIVGGGPAGMAAADCLNKMGHTVTVYERQDRVGGLLQYGIPNMKLEKTTVQRRVDLLAAEGITFKTNCEIGKNVDAKELLTSSDAMLLTVGATWPRDLPIPGRELNGVHFAMDFLTPTTKKLMEENSTKTDLDWTISAKGKKVVVIGGGDTGNDCIGTSVRMGATGVTNFEILPPPPPSRADENPWPTWPRIFRVDYGHSEVETKFARDPRVFNIMAKEFVGDGEGNLKGVTTVKVEWTKDDKGAWKMAEVPDSLETYECDLVFIAMGFLGPEATLKDALGTDVDARSNIKTPAGRYSTSVDKLYAAGDCRRGQSLIVWAISEGRQAARQIDLDLTGWTTLPLPGGVIPRKQEVAQSPPLIGR